MSISESSFIGEYSNFRSNAKKQDIVSLFYNYRRQNDYSVKFSSEGDGNRFDLSNILLGPYFSLSNSCNRVNVYLVNPSIRKLRALPTGSYCWEEDYGVPQDVPQVGIGFNAFTGEYKFVRIFRRTEFTGCEVYMLGDFCSPSSWKVINDAPLAPSSHSLPIFVNGNVENSRHGEVRPEIVLSFDIKNEKFDVILLPERSSRPACSRVVELGGQLCVADTDAEGMQMDVWVLDDHSECRWTKGYIFYLLAKFDHYPALSFQTKPVAIQDGKIVFFNNPRRKDCYNPEIESFVKHENSMTVVEHDAPYTESLVWPGSARFRD